MYILSSEPDFSAQIQVIKQKKKKKKFFSAKLKLSHRKNIENSNKVSTIFKFLIKTSEIKKIVKTANINVSQQPWGWCYYSPFRDQVKHFLSNF